MSSKIKKNQFSFKLPLILLGILIILMVMIRSDFLKIKQVDLVSQNLDCVDPNFVEKFLLNQNILTVNEKALEGKLKEKFFCLKKINLIRTLPNKLTIELNGREAAFILIGIEPLEATASALSSIEATPSANLNLDGRELFSLDNEGIIFSKAKDRSLPKIFTSEEITLGKHLENGEKIVKILGRIKTFGLNNVESKIVSKYLVVTSYDTKLKIFFSLEKDIETQLASLQLILNEAKIESKDQLEFIDLRFDKPVLKLAPKETKR